MLLIRSNAGLYGDVVEELDAAVGRLVDAFHGKFGGDAMIIITSDNGPWYEGSTGGLRDRKGSSFAGGFRVPFIVRWPGGRVGGRARRRDSEQDEAIVSHTPAHGTDLFPTIMAVAGLPLPRDRLVDGVSLIDAWRGASSDNSPGTGKREWGPPGNNDDDDGGNDTEDKRKRGGETPRSRTLRLFHGTTLVAVRRERWVLHLQHMVLPHELVRARWLGQHSQEERCHTFLLATAGPQCGNAADQGNRQCLSSREDECDAIHKNPWLWLTDTYFDPTESYDASARNMPLAISMAAEATAWGSAFKRNPRGWVDGVDANAGHEEDL